MRRTTFWTLVLLALSVGSVSVANGQEGSQAGERPDARVRVTQAVEPGASGTGVFGTSLQWVGVSGQATATSGGPAYGVWGDSLSSDGVGVAGFADATSGPANGVFGQSASTSGSGLVGFANASSGFTNGMSGRSVSPNGNGVAGFADATSGFNNGVYGQTASNEGDAVHGDAVNASGSAAGVFGTSVGAGGETHGCRSKSGTRRTRVT